MRAHREETRAFRRWALRLSAPLLLAALAFVAWPRRPAGPARLDPELFRKEIETIESVLYRGDRQTPEDRGTLSRALQVLVGSLRGWPPSEAKRRASTGMEQFLILTAVDSDLDRLDPVAARHRWEALRGEYFADAPWFERGSAALETAQASAESRGVPADMDAYDQSLAAIRSLITSARVSADELSADGSNPDLAAYDTWQRNKAQLQEDVAWIRERLPLKSDEVDPAWKVARSDLERALNRVAAVLNADPRTSTLQPHPVTTWERLRRAEIDVEAAGESIARASR
jgi:hypothetical protein